MVDCEKSFIITPCTNLKLKSSEASCHGDIRWLYYPSVRNGYDTIRLTIRQGASAVFILNSLLATDKTINQSYLP